MLTAIIIWSIVIILFLIGIAGSILPMLPGSPFILLGAIIYGIWNDFEDVTIGTLVTLGVITLIVIALDYLSQAYGTRKYGASKLAQTLTFFGALIGIFTGLWGVLIFPIIGAIIGELINGRDVKQAARAGIGSFVGFLGGTFIKFVAAAIMIGIFFVAAL